MTPNVWLQVNQLLLTLVAFASLQGVLGDCVHQLHRCTSQFEQTAEEKNLIRETSLEFCTVLLDYGTCIKHTARACRGDISFLSLQGSVRALMSNFNCSALVDLKKMAPDSLPARPSIIPELPSNALPPPAPPHRYCTFHGSERYRYCGLFGDPHLKTFRNKYQTCRVKGAWPLIDNPYLGVQVTNDPVVDGSPATVTTKVTVIIKGRDTHCTQEKTFEATADQPLPASFVDGTRTSGQNNSVSLTLHDIDVDHQSVEIRLNYIKTTLIVRQVGKYLAFAAQLPEELAELGTDGNLQLCDTGCPMSERLDLVKAHGREMAWQDALRLCQQDERLSNEINNNLTDHYLDWCVFDVMTTGPSEARSFTMAAHSAQADALRFEPHALKNRTEPKLRPRDISSGAQCAFSRIFVWLVLVGAVTWPVLFA